MSSEGQTVSDPMGEIQEAGIAQIGQLIVATRAARALFTAVELGVFDALASNAGTAASVAQTIDADPRRTEILLDALASVGLVHKKADGAYANTQTGERFLVTDSPQSLASNLRYQEKLAPAWAALPEIVRTGQPHCGLVELLEQDPKFTEHYIRGMAEIAKPSAQDLVRQLDLTDCKTALDVGGGPGTYAAALAQASDAMEVHLLDLAPTLKIAEAMLAETPGGDRVRLREGNYLEADYGTSEYDLVLLSHVTHDEGEDANLKMLQRAYKALRPGGVVVIHDFMVDSTGTQPTFGALFSLHLATYTQKGRTYSSDEYCSWMQQCGFKEPARLSVCSERPNGTEALVGAKP